MFRHRFAVWNRSLLAALATLPFILSIAVHAIGSTPREPTGSVEPRPALVFNQYLVDMGRDPVAPRPIVYGHFTFRNVSDRPVEIAELVPSCGCLQPVLENQNLGSKAYADASASEPVGLRIFQPGQIGGFTVKIQTASESPGAREYRVVVKYKDPEPRETLVTFRMVLPTKQVYVQPKAVLVYILGDKPVTQTITLTDERRKKIEIESIATSLDFLEITVDEPRTVGARHEIPIKVFVPAIPPGKHEGLIRIKTNDPKFEEIRVPVIVQSARLPS